MDSGIDSRDLAHQAAEFLGGEPAHHRRGDRHPGEEPQQVYYLEGLALKALERPADAGSAFALALISNGLSRMGELVSVPIGKKVLNATICDAVFIDKENIRRDS